MSRLQQFAAGPEASPADQAVLIEALRNPARYDHPVQEIRVRETHISWIILTGAYAYKIKKAVDFGFLDFSTLAKRHFYCLEELRLNRRFAPDLYLDVISLSGDRHRPQLRGTGRPLEYAVVMRQFPQDGLLSAIAARHGLTSAHVDEIAQLVAAMHAQVDCATPDSPHGRPEDVHHWVMENFAHIRPSLQDDGDRQALDRIGAWCQLEYHARRDLVDERRHTGHVRECHGDLHLGNLAMINGRITPFDGIEFNPQLRWIDVMSEVAFLVMDLQDRGHAGLAWRFLDAYLRETGDYAGVRLLDYYLVYRALVRAKVAILRLGQPGLDMAGQQAVRDEYRSYMALAGQCTGQRRAALIITHGVSGSGKSWHAARLVEQLGAIRIRSDVERKRLFGYAADADTGSGIQSGIYTAAASERTYEQLARLARHVLDAGSPVIIDAAFLMRQERDRFRQLAAAAGVPFMMLVCNAPEDILRRRILMRQAADTDPSEAGIAVLEAQLKSREPPGADEQGDSVTLEPGDVEPGAALADWIAGHMK
jgi:aminoglycoside phosphotransferase family enzyme/predicted kinase